MVAPIEHVREGLKLTADAVVDLYKIDLKLAPTTFYFKNNDTVTWQGNTYTGMACRLVGDTATAEPEEARASLQIMNPDGIFNKPIGDGVMDFATVTRRRVLRAHIDANTNIFEQRMWYISRIRELIRGQHVTFELKNLTEGPNFLIPVRQFMPPEFPIVSL